ncbi:MAG TPA: hypothetical protein VG796_17245 [Verrucomicrobiales bacterium]|jgi:hypothetical protein|nr:hypothetical protein [Verrucomicrobiales bacterium]
MIALPSQLPLLRVGRYELSTYEAEWLEESIKDAAREAGHDEWWFACDITRSLMLYLRNKFAGTAITIDEMTRRIRQILGKIGFKDIGDRVNLAPPLLQVSLHDLAVEAEGFELRFFQLLEERLAELMELGARRITLSHARRGVKTLRAARNWGPKCEELEQNIVGFLRSRLLSRPECSVEMKYA